MSMKMLNKSPFKGCGGIIRLPTTIKGEMMKEIMMEMMFQLRDSVIHLLNPITEGYGGIYNAPLPQMMEQMEGKGVRWVF